MKAIDTHLAGKASGDTLATRMRQSRVRAQLTIKRAAALIGISESQLGRIERGG